MSRAAELQLLFTLAKDTVERLAVLRATRWSKAATLTLLVSGVVVVPLLKKWLEESAPGYTLLASCILKVLEKLHLEPDLRKVRPLSHTPWSACQHAGLLAASRFGEPRPCHRQFECDMSAT